ncbi:MAG: phosphate acyltransferase PlsX [Alphaproteobacteria bacterium]|nr:MAG: phosphate acyltransferase PlsX [Alphaproteobacteria bacterium]
MRNGLVISLDGMGGDKAPHIVVEGAHLAREKFPEAKFIIYGDEAQIRPLVKKYEGLESVMEVRHTPDRVTAEDKPANALRHGRNSSMRLAIDTVAKGEADCVISAGNTGALMAMAKFSLKVMPGIHRPAIATYMPTKVAGHGTIFMDLGANAECTSQNLLEFAVLGGVFSREIFKIPEPRIALLNIGSEAMKGDELVKAASEVFAAARLPGKYVGYAEGNEIMTGDFDVVVTDGFTGNVTLKTMEGTASLIKHMMKEAFKSSWWVKLGMVLCLPSLPGLLIIYMALKKFSKRIDPRYYNGASLLGLKGLCIKSHGGTDGIGFANAIGVAAGLAANRFTDKVETELRRLGFEGHIEPLPEVTS